MTGGSVCTVIYDAPTEKKQALLVFFYVFSYDIMIKRLGQYE